MCSGCVYETIENPVIQRHPFLRGLFGYDYKESVYRISDF